MTNTATALQVLHETIPPVQKAGEVKLPGLAALSDVDIGFMRLVDLLGFSRADFTRPLTLEEAIQLSAVQACMDVISQDIAKVRLRLYRAVPGGKQAVMPGEHWLAALLATEPNRRMTWYEFNSMLLLHFGILQNAFIAKKMQRNGQVAELQPVLPGRIEVLINEEEGTYGYKVRRDSPHERVMLRDFGDMLLEDEMIHLRGRMFDGFWGYSNLTAGAKSMNLMREIIDFQTRLYRNDAQMRGVFQMKPTEGVVGGAAISDEAFRRLREQLQEAMGAFGKSGKPLVLEDGLEFKPISMEADAAEVAKARDQAIADVARTLRIPPHKVFHLVNVKYENMDTFERGYVHDSLIPICRNFEERLGADLLSAKDREQYFLQFDREEMLLNDVKTIGEFVQKMVGLGVMTINEARQRFFLNMLPGEDGDVRLVPSTYTVIGPGNEIIIAAGGLDPNAEPPEDNPATNGDKE